MWDLCFDLHFVRGEIPLPVVPPVTLGHEAAGVVEAVGGEVPVWKAGDRVAVAAGKACLACTACAAGRLEECRAPQVMGVSGRRPAGVGSTWPST